MKKPRIEAEELKDENLNHVILLQKKQDDFKYIELAGSDSRIQTVPSTYVDHYGVTNDIEANGEWVKHFKTIKKEKLLYCAVNLSKTYGNDRDFHERFMRSLKSQPFRVIAALSINISKMSVSASPVSIKVTWRHARLNKKKSTNSKFSLPIVGPREEYSVTTTPRGATCRCSSGDGRAAGDEWRQQMLHVTICNWKRKRLGCLRGCLRS